MNKDYDDLENAYLLGEVNLDTVLQICDEQRDEKTHREQGCQCIECRNI